MRPRGIDGGGILAASTHFGLDLDRPILPTKGRVIKRYADWIEYPNTITPRSIEAAVRERVASGMDHFAAMRQVLEGVARWGEAE